MPTTVEIIVAKSVFFLLICLICVFAVKPDPPESVLVNELEGFPKRLIVSWTFPASWPLHDAFPLVFQIRYRPLGSMYWSEVSKRGQRCSLGQTGALHQTDGIVTMCMGCSKENITLVSHIAPAADILLTVHMYSLGCYFCKPSQEQKILVKTRKKV